MRNTFARLMCCILLCLYVQAVATSGVCLAKRFNDCGSKKAAMLNLDICKKASSAVVGLDAPFILPAQPALFVPISTNTPPMPEKTVASVEPEIPEKPPIS